MFGVVVSAPPSTSPVICARIDVRRVAAGIALLSIPPATVALVLASGVGPVPTGLARTIACGLVAMLLFVGVWACLALGTMLLCSARWEACSACALPLHVLTARFGVEHYPDLVRRVETSGPLTLIAVYDAPRPGTDAAEVAAIDVELCPSCRRIGRLTVQRQRRGPSGGAFQTLDTGMSRTVSGWTMEQLARVAEERGVATLV